MRLRLNQEYRNKIANRMRVHIEAEDTQEKEKYFQARESIKPEQDKAWDLAHTIVRRHYTESDVEKARYLQNKFENVDTIASDSCFHLGYNGQVEERDENDKPKMVDKRINHHFDFKIDGGISGLDNGRQDHDFAYAYFRDELKAQEGCNPDINIEMSDKERNPHQTKFCDANDKYLGTGSGKDHTSHSREWNDDYKLDLIGREYCRDRQLDCSKQEYDTMMIWQQAKGHLIQCHSKWITSVLNQMKEIKIGLKGYRYLDEALELSSELGLKLDESEIIRTNSTGLTIYNPKNLADRIKAMKNTEKTREQKIAERLVYNKSQAVN